MQSISWLLAQTHFSQIWTKICKNWWTISLTRKMNCLKLAVRLQSNTSKCCTFKTKILAKFIITPWSMRISTVIKKQNWSFCPLTVFKLTKKNLAKKEIFCKYSSFVAKTLKIKKDILLEFQQIQLKPTTKKAILSTITKVLLSEMEFKSMGPTCTSFKT